MSHTFLQFSPKITILPVVHGSGDFALEVRRVLLTEKFDCLAVPLPESFQSAVEEAIEALPTPTIVIRSEEAGYRPDASEDEGDTESLPLASYVPIDPCQPVIAALRFAIQEQMPRAFIDLETEGFHNSVVGLPDPYALKKVAVEKFSAAVLPSLPRPTDERHCERIAWMAQRLRQLERKYKRILFVCSLADWPWIREAYTEKTRVDDPFKPEHDPWIYKVAPENLIFLLGEMPYITGLYEKARAELDDDENLSVDGVKELLLTSREKYKEELKGRARHISPHLLSNYLKYVRNLSLIERRMTPDLYTLIVAAQQTAGDQFAIHLAETARSYPYDEPHHYDTFHMSIDRGQLPGGEMVKLQNRLPGNPVVWRTCQLNRRPPKIDQDKWKMEWNPFGQCSWPPEDIAIERFRTHVKDKALSLMGNDLARSEKFTTSLKDGLDIRETLRNWHTGDLYVKILPPAQGTLDCVIMLFDSPADPRDYPWRITWHAETHDESTLSFFATPFSQEVIGPGIAMATYGGSMFLFPPRSIPDIWRDPRFDFADTLEERLLAGACFHSQQPQIALLSAMPPGAGWRRMAKKYHKKLVHVPMGQFSQETIQQLRMFHVLNGRQVRSYAEHFIRKA